jgi:hypothetical protein
MDLLLFACEALVVFPATSKLTKERRGNNEPHLESNLLW